jgi:hypothetical protein
MTTTTIHKTLRSAPSIRIPAGMARLLEEVSVLLWALLNPRAVIAEVEQTRALLAQADAVEARDPQRAQALRTQAARIGLR